MNPTQHHQGLNDNQVRDLIASGLRDHEVQVGFYDQSERYRNMLVEQVEASMRKLASFDQGVALRRIADRFEWNTHEPESAPIWERDMYDPKTYRQFIGTGEEFAEAYKVRKYTKEELEAMSYEDLREMAKSETGSVPRARKHQLVAILLRRQNGPSS